MELPDKVKVKIPSKEGKSIFMDAFNRAYEGTGGMESVAFAAAWNAIKMAGYKPDVDGEYHHMTSYSQRNVETDKIDMASVHVETVEDDISVLKLSSGDMVEWNSSGGKARGKIVSIHRDGNVPNIPVKITASEDEPAARIQIYRDGEPTDTFVGHKLDTLIKNCGDKNVFEITKKQGFTFNCEISKLDEEKRLVYGWASIVEENGVPIKDFQGDIITPAELAKAAHEYMITSRTAKVMHKGARMGELVESVVFTKELQNSLSIDLGKQGWFVGFKIYDDETWLKVKKGELRMFSIGGRGKRASV